MRLSPASKHKLARLQSENNWGAKVRVHKQCKVCKRSCNEMDPVNQRKRLRWSYPKKTTTCPETNLELVSGKVDHYCNKVSYALINVSSWRS